MPRTSVMADNLPRLFIELLGDRAARSYASCNSTNWLSDDGRGTG